MTKLTDVEFMYYCPVCGYECGHVIEVSELNEGEYKSDGAVIYLECEGCGYQSKIVFGDHKGNVYITVRGELYLQNDDEVEKKEVWYDVSNVIKKSIYVD